MTSIASRPPCAPPSALERAPLREIQGPRTLIALLVGVLALAGLLLVVAIDRIQTTLLEHDAIAKGLHWTDGLLGTLETVDSVFSGGDLSDRDRETIALASRLGGLKAFLIFDLDGRVIAASDPADLGTVNRSPYWASEVLRGSPHAAIEAVPAIGSAAAGIVAETYLPVFREADGARSVAGAFEAYLDVSDAARSYSRIGLYASTVGVALIAMAGAVAVAFVRRTILFRVERERMLSAAQRTAEASNAAKSRFLATMSHEIRTPMNGILATVDLLQTTELADDQSEMAAIIRQSATALLDLLNQILDQSKIEAGKLAIVPAPFALAGFLSATVDVLRSAAHAKGLSLSVEAAADLPPVVIGDEARLRQILLNLIGNALKFTAQGTVVVAANRHGEGGDRLAIRVRDTGIGIAPDALGRLFDPFEQEDASTTRRFGGTGLGLAIARELAELMGGTLTVASTPGAGSEFCLEVPLPASDLTPAPPAEPARPVALDLAVLVADDDATNRWVIGRQLERLACRATVVDDGQAALDAWRADPARWQVIVTDWHMPGLDGLGLLSALQSDPAFLRRRTTVVMLTASGLPEEIDRARRAGADAVLVKPVTLGQLAAALSETVGVDAPPPVRPEASAANDAGAETLAVLDTRELEELCDGSPQMLADILSRFGSRLTDGLAELAASTDADRRSAAAHALRGAAAAVGAFALSAACGRLETAGDDDAAPMAAVEREAGRVMAAVQTRISQGDPRP